MNKIKKTITCLSLSALLLTNVSLAQASETEVMDLGSPEIISGVTGSAFENPVALPVAGTYTSTESVVLSANGASYIRYTSDGSEPTCSEGTVYTVAIAVGSSMTIKAISCAGDVSSMVKTFTYTVNIPVTQPSTPSGGGGGGGGDRTAPTNISILVNSDVASTDIQTVVLTMSATGASKMMLANDVGFTAVEWEDYDTLKTSWTLTDEFGFKTVYAKFKDASGNISGITSDYIEFVEAPVNPDETIVIVTEEDSDADGVVVAGVEADWRTIQLAMIMTEAKMLFQGDKQVISAEMGRAVEEVAENDSYNKYTLSLLEGQEGLTEKEINSITYFILYGTQSTEKLGAGERAGVVNSYKAAFGKLPRTESEWADLLKIANGRWPEEKSETAEAAAKLQFEKIYLRVADMESSNDNAAVTIMAYGLRTDSRNMVSEATAIKTFKHIFGFNPITAIDWDSVRAIAYSGAQR